MKLKRSRQSNSIARFFLSISSMLLSVTVTGTCAIAEQPYCHLPQISMESELSRNPYDQDRWNRYWKRILHELLGDDINAYLGVSPTLRIVTAPAPTAYALRPDQLIISSGLLNLVDTPSELAFVIAHEVSHVMLKHLDRFEDQSTLDGMIENELKADAYALKLLREGGFETSAALSMLHKLRNFGREHGTQLEQAFPSLAIRFEEINRSLSSEVPSLG